MGSSKNSIRRISAKLLVLDMGEINCMIQIVLSFIFPNKHSFDVTYTKRYYSVTKNILYFLDWTSKRESASKIKKIIS